MHWGCVFPITSKTSDTKTVESEMIPPFFDVSGKLVFSWVQKHDRMTIAYRYFL